MSSETALAGLKVLVVEDEALVAMLMEDMLADLGCQVVGPVGELDEAVALAAGGEFDIALLDMNLAGRSVLPVADALKARGRPFAFASGYGEAGVQGDHRDRPVLQKPFREADLAKVLKDLAPA